MGLSVFCATLFVLVARAEGAILNAPFQWELLESTIVPDNPYCFDKDPDTAVVVFDGGSTITPLTHCATCFGLWKDAGRDEYCIFFIPSATNKLDYDLANKYLFPVKATDGTATVASATVTLQILKNTPPYFTQVALSATVTVPVATAVDDTIYTIPVDDLNENIGDLVYTIDAYNQFFYFDQADINVKAELDVLCADTVELAVRISDKFNPEIGPFKVIVNIDRAGKSYKPVMTSTNEIINRKENSNAHFIYFKGDKQAGGSCTISANPTLMASYYSFVCGSAAPYMIQVKSANFETDSSINFTIVYNNGFCDSDPFWYFINWTDEPETPSLTATPVLYTINEDVIREQPLYVISDEDTTDTFKYVITSDPSGKFSIVESTGELYTVAYYSLTNVASEIVIIDVLVSDSANLLSNTVQFSFTILDINDNRPIFDAFTTAYSFSDCSTIGLITTITVQDNDFGTNGEIDFIPATSQSMRIAANGDLFLKAQPIANSVDTLIIRAVDRGNPFKTSLDGSISVSGTTCFTVAATTVSLNTSANANSANIFDSPWNIALIAIGAIVFVVIAVLSVYFIYRCCTSGARQTANISRSPKNSVSPNTPPFKKDNPKNNLSGDYESGVYSNDGYLSPRSALSVGRISRVSLVGSVNDDRGFFDDKVVGKPSSSHPADFWKPDFRAESMTHRDRNSFPAVSF